MSTFTVSFQTFSILVKSKKGFEITNFLENLLALGVSELTTKSALERTIITMNLHDDLTVEVRL